MIKYRIKTKAEFEADALKRDYGSLSDYTGWDMGLECCGRWFGVEITKDEYDFLKRDSLESSWGEDGLYSRDMECYDELESLSRIGNPDYYDSEWTIYFKHVIMYRADGVKLYKNIGIGDIILYRKIGRTVKNIYVESDGTYIEFEVDGVNKYTKYKNVKKVDDKILNKVK